MARETSISREALKLYLDQTAQHIGKAYGVDVWFAEIMGRRWSYIAGRKEQGTSLLPPRRIELTGRFGIVSNGWENIPADEIKRLIASMREAVRAYG